MKGREGREGKDWVFGFFRLDLNLGSEIGACWYGGLGLVLNNCDFGFFRLGLDLGSGIGTCWDRGLGLGLDNLHAISGT